MRSGALITDSPIDRPIPWHQELLLTPRSTNKFHAIGSSYRSSLIHPISRQNLCDWKLLSELIDKHYQPTNSLPSVKLLSELLESTDRPTNSLRLGALIRVHLPTRSGALIRAHWLPDRPANSLRSVPLIGAHWPPDRPTIPCDRELLFSKLIQPINQLFDQKLLWDRELLTELIDWLEQSTLMHTTNEQIPCNRELLSELIYPPDRELSSQSSLTPRSTNKFLAIGSSYRSSLIYPINQKNNCDRSNNWSFYRSSLTYLIDQ